MKILKKALIISLSISLLATSCYAFSSTEKDSFTDRKEMSVKKSKAKLTKIKADKDFVIITDDDNGNFSFTNSNSVTDKAAYLEKLTSTYAQDTTKYCEGSQVLPALTSSINTWFESTLNCRVGYVVDSVSTSGEATTIWCGSSPYNAENLSFADTFSFSGTVINSLSISGSAGWTGSGSTITYQNNNLKNRFSYSHSYAGIGASGANLSWYNQTTQGDYVLSGNGYTSWANGEIYLR